MTHQPFGPRWRVGLVVGTLLVGVAAAARAQSQATITGRITSERGDPLVGARISIDATPGKDVVVADTPLGKLGVSSPQAIDSFTKRVPPTLWKA